MVRVKLYMGYPDAVVDFESASSWQIRDDRVLGIVRSESSPAVEGAKAYRMLAQFNAGEWSQVILVENPQDAR